MPPRLPLTAGQLTATAKTLILVNPAAGGGRGKHAQAAVADYLRSQSFAVDFVCSESSEDLRRRAAEAAARYQTILTLGGDGAFFHLVNATFSRGVVLGILPAGNGNDIAAALGLPNDPVAAAQALLHGALRRVDGVRTRLADGQSALYVGTGGMGLDAEAAQLASARFRRLPGAARYIAGALWSLATFQPIRMEAEIDGEPWSGPVLLAAVSNAPAYGSGIRIAPEAQIDDGWLDLTLVSPLSWTRIVEAIPMLLGTGDVHWPEIQRRRARRLRLCPDRPALVHADGEVLGRGAVEFEVLPGAICVLAPSRP